MLVPLVSSPTTNLPYVQQMDEFFMVKEFVPFLEFENYPVVPGNNARVIAIRDQGLVAFRTPDDSIFCGNLEETLAFLKDNRELVSRSATLRIQLNRVESVELRPSYDAWRTVADAVFEDEDQKKLWIDSELLIFQKQKQIWSDIDPIEPTSPSATKSALPGSLAEYGFEFLIRWLANRNNFNAAGWTTVWHHVKNGLPFDERVPQIGISWMYALGEEDFDFQQSKSILCVLLQHDRSPVNINWRELGEFVSERLNSQPYLLYEFLKPNQLFASLFAFLASHGNTDDFLKLTEFCIADVPKDEVMMNALEIGLECILERFHENHLDLPPTDQQQFQTASSLIQMIRDLRTAIRC
jgi:hypothetical protein